MSTRRLRLRKGQFNEQLYPVGRSGTALDLNEKGCWLKGHFNTELWRKISTDIGGSALDISVRDHGRNRGKDTSRGNYGGEISVDTNGSELKSRKGHFKRRLSNIIWYKWKCTEA